MNKRRIIAPIPNMKGARPRRVPRMSAAPAWRILAWVLVTAVVAMAGSFGASTVAPPAMGGPWASGPERGRREA